MRISSVLLAVLCVLHVGCSPSSQNTKSLNREETVAVPPTQQSYRSQNVLRVNIRKEPTSIDPARARELQSIAIVRALFEGLTRVNRAEQPELALAEKYVVSEDLKTYTFTLREARWTNGDLVTAHDFVHAWRRIIDPNFPADNAFHLYVVRNGKEIRSGNMSVEELGIEAIDEKTLVVHLQDPIPYFLDLLSYPAFFPINEKVDKMDPGWAEDIERFVGNGPFVMKQWKHQDSIYVEKNSTYWDADAVKLEGIHMLMVADEAEIAMFESKELDWAGSPLSRLSMDCLSQWNQEISLEKKEILGTYFINTNTQKLPFCSVKIRRAFSSCIDREMFVEQALSGTQLPAYSIVPPSLSSFCPLVEKVNAQTLMAEGMQELGIQNMPEVEYIYYAAAEMDQRIALALQQEWESALGVKVRLQALERRVLLDRIGKGEFDLAATNWMADYNDPMTFLSIFQSRNCAANRTCWEDPEYAALLEESSRVIDRGIRKGILARSEVLLSQAIPAIPLFHFRMFYLKQDRVKDILLSGMGGWDFKWAHIVDVDRRGDLANREGIE